MVPAAGKSALIKKIEYFVLIVSINIGSLVKFLTGLFLYHATVFLRIKI